MLCKAMALSLEKNKALIGGVDSPLLFCTGSLLIVGLLVLSSASLGVGALRFDDSYYYVKHQLFFGVAVGAFLFLLGLSLNVSLWKKYALFLLLGSFIITALVFIPGIGFRFSGAQRWIHAAGLSIQPAELLKFSFVVYLSAWLANRKKHITSFSEGFMPFLLMTGIVGFLLVLQPDVGTLGVLSLTALSLFFIAGGKLKQIAAAIFIGVLLLGVLVLVEPYRMSRILTFVNPNSDTLAGGYQIHQALVAIESGGIFGKGFGFGTQKFRNLPEPLGDSIFAVFAEEMGFVGSMVLLLLFAFFIIRILHIAKNVTDGFSALLVAGFGFLIFWQAFINIGAISGVLPLTGLPLPFVSYGGTTLAFLLGEVGIILNISRS